MNTRTITLLVLLTGLHFFADAQLKLSGEFRTRSIIDHGYAIPVLENTSPEFSVDQRTRINLDFKNEKLSSHISLQDSRIWGNDNLTTKAGAWGNSNSLSIHQAWVNLNLASKANLKIGRQEFNYDNMRLLSYRNWATSALSYDAALLQSNIESLGISFHLAVSYNNNSNAMNTIDNSTWQSDKLKTLNFIYLKKQLSQSSYVAILSALSGKTDTANNAILGTGTHGIVANINNGKQAKPGLFGNFEAYYQHGTDLIRGSNGKYKNILAYMFNAELGYRSSNKKLEIISGVELISGHDYKNTDANYNNTRHTFDFLYGGRLPFYGGYMNYFTVQESYLAGTKSGGYFDPYIKTKYKLNKKNVIEAAAYFPFLNTPVRAHNAINTQTKKPQGAETDNNGNAVYWQGSLGTYFDLSYTHKISSEFVIKAGASYAMASDIKNQMVFGYANAQEKTLNKLGNNYFGWLMVIIKPTFFSNIK